MQVDDPRRMIEAYRVRVVPDAHAKALLLERVLAAEPGPPRVDTRRLALLVGLTVALAAALLLVLAGITGALELRDEVPAREQAVHGAAPTLEPAAARPHAPVASPPRVEPRSTAVVEVAPVERSEVRARVPVRSARPTPVPEPTTPSTVVEEGRLLARAQAALRDGEPQRALLELTAHAQRFPAGAMAIERDALQLVAVCENGERDANRERARAFAARADAASYAARIRRACRL